MTPTRERPGSVTFVVFLTWLFAMSNIVFGALFLMGRLGPELIAGVSQSQLTLYAWTLIGLGILAAFTASGLASGARFARWIVVFLMVVRIASDVWAYATVADFPLWQGIVHATWALIIIAMVSTRRAVQFFRA